MRKKFIYVLWALVVGILLVIAFIFTAIAKGWIGYVPPIEELENPNLKFATEIISDDGKMLGTWSLSKENRVFVGYDQLSPNLIHALIATEDERFAEHSGIDARAFVRALVKRGVMMQKNAGGGSTITQQLAKQFYSPTADNVMERLLQKPIEWVIAVQLERYYTKEEILTMYLNKFDFLNNAVGIKTAANTYFSKEPKDLSIEEAATLVGMCKNPSLYNPKRFNERSRGRRNVVLDQIVFAVHGLQRFAQTRELLAGVDVGVVLVHHAALELRALSGEFLGIERNFLYAGGAGRDARKTRHPRCAAQLASAGTQSADASRLLPRADLFHLDTYVEPFCEDLD